jgi:hypothetical protein
MLRLRPTSADQRRPEHGQALVMFTLVLVVILAAAALVVDVGVLRNNRQILVNAIDAGALAGGTLLPVTGATERTAANALIDRTVQANYPNITSSAYTITYRCLIGVTPAGQPNIARDVPLVCDPSNSLGRAPVSSDFIGAGPTRVSSCDPARGDKCNVVVVSGSTLTDYGLGPVVGVDRGSTGVVSAAACQGPCGDNPNLPVDVMLVIDRSSSMSGVDTVNSLAAANSVRTGYDPAQQWLGLGLLGPSVTSGSCLVAPSSSIGSATIPTDLRRWVPVGLSGIGAPLDQDYRLSTSTLATNLVQPCYRNSSTGTDLKDPIPMAVHELQTYGRAGVHKGIIFESDGKPNASVSGNSNYCLEANQAATNAKSQGIEIFTVAFGLDGANDELCPDPSGPFRGRTASYLLASMATQPSSNALGCPGTGATNTNNDGDHYFCLPKTAGASASLANVFQTAASQLARTGSKLIELYPAPIVTTVGPNSGPATGGGTVTISGHYFSGATRVSFGSTGAPFTVVSDTSITVTVPAGTAGQSVNVVVVTPAGSSVVSSAVQYSYT